VICTRWLSVGQIYLLVICKNPLAIQLLLSGGILQTPHLYCFSMCFIEIINHGNKPWWWRSCLKDLFGFCVSLCRFWHRLQRLGVFNMTVALVSFFRDLCSVWCLKSKSCALFTGDLGLFWTPSFFFLGFALAHFFDLTCIFFGLDFVACFIFFILFTNTSSSDSDSSPCLGGGIL